MSLNAPVQVIPWKRVKNEPDVDVKNEASTSNPDPAMKEPVPEPLL